MTLGSTEMVGAGRRREPASALRSRATGPHAVLGAAALAALLGEYQATRTGSAVWMLLVAGVALAAFFVVWRQQERIRLVPLLALSLAYQLAWIGIHLHLGLESLDSSVLYRRWGNALLDGHYPDAQYPPGAVLLFTLDAWLGGGPTRVSHAFVMIPFQLLTVVAVWALRTRWSPWFAALVALWPMNAFFWEFRFDLVPTAFLAVGLVLAFRERWALSGAALATGAAAKWAPALAAAALVVWLIASGRWRQARRHTASFAVVFVLFHLPFLVWSPGETLYSYRYFGGQGLTGESLWYLLLAPFGLARVDRGEFWLPAGAPGWADATVVVLQLALLVALAAVAVAARSSLRAGVAVAAMAPVIFLLTNRVFSPQYLVLMLAAWAMAGALLVESRREQVVLGVAIMATTMANAFVYPYTLLQLGLWRVASAVLFAVGLATSIWIVVRALQVSGAPRQSPAAPPSARTRVTAENP
jgi:uncharacterized membrane protein